MIALILRNRRIHIDRCGYHPRQRLKQQPDLGQLFRRKRFDPVDPLHRIELIAFTLLVKENAEGYSSAFLLYG
jgi:hypothetical protein